MVRDISRGPMKAQVLKPILAAGYDLTQMDIAKLSTKPGKAQSWQRQAWDFVDVVPDFAYGVGWVGNLLSKGKLKVLENGKETANPEATAAMEAFFGGSDQHGEFLRQAGTHMTVAGEFYVVGWEEDDPTDPDSLTECWEVIAATKLTRSALGLWKITGRGEIDPILVMRILKPHPEDSRFSTCNTRALLGTLAELHLYEKYVHAQGDSRLTGNGILAVPSSASFPTVTVTNADGTTSEQPGTEASFLQQLYDIAKVAKKDPESAAARLPILLQMDGEDIGHMQHITFWSEFDSAVPDLRKEARITLATGLDMPPEVLTGTADMSHWNAWQVEEASIKAHTEPLLAIITAGLTTGYLRPMLMKGVDENGNITPGMTKEEAAAFTVAADTTGLRLRPNKSQEAMELYDRGELSAAALLRENGFDVEDAMKPAELRIWLAKKLALGAGSATPEQLAAVAKVLGNLELPDGVVEEGDQPGPTDRGKPSLENHPEQGPPELPAKVDQAAILVAMANPVVFRALERAGNRAKTRFRSSIPEGVDAVDAYRFLSLTTEDISDLLTDAFGNLGRVTAGFDIDSHKLGAALNGYVRMLMETKSEHDPVVMRNYLGRVES